MGDFPQIGNPSRRSVTISVPPYWCDHHYQGRTVLPAVEAMQMLAHWVQGGFPQLDVTRIDQARFDKFLPLSTDSAYMQAFCETVADEGGGVRAALITKTTGKTTRISRAIVHARLDFGHLPDQAPCLEHDVMLDLGSSPFSVDADRIYAELVPFGPGYRNIQGTLQLWPQGARAAIRAPDLTDSQAALPLGSPFVLDAAFHAACVWSQRYAGVIAFPVGIGRRLIHRPTRTGGAYQASIVASKTDRPHLEFDIRITDENGILFEQVHAVRMRDVSGGRLKPPSWIGSDQSGGA